jgi:hypothetical protein
MFQRMDGRDISIRYLVKEWPYICRPELTALGDEYKALYRIRE